MGLVAVMTISNSQLLDWQVAAQRDDWRETFVASDIRRILSEIERLRAALKEIADDPTGVSSYQADIAKRALGIKEADNDQPPPL